MVLLNQIGFQFNEVTYDGKRLVWNAQRIKEGYKGQGWATYMLEKCMELSLKTHIGVETTTGAKILTPAVQKAFEKGNAYGTRLVWTWVRGNN